MIDLFAEFERVVRAFNGDDITYALIGGVALAAYGHPRLTKDIDFLVKEEDIPRIRETFDTIEYFESATPWTFRTTGLTLYRFMRIERSDTLVVDILACPRGEFRPVLRYARRERWKDFAVRVARKKDLIWMKRMRNSAQDKADIERLQNDEA